MSKYSITIFLSFFVFFGYSQNKKELNATILRLQSDSALMSNTIAEKKIIISKKITEIEKLNSINKSNNSEIDNLNKIINKKEKIIKNLNLENSTLKDSLNFLIKENDSLKLDSKFKVHYNLKFKKISDEGCDSIFLIDFYVNDKLVFSDIDEITGGIGNNQLKERGEQSLKGGFLKLGFYWCEIVYDEPIEEGVDGSGGYGGNMTYNFLKLNNDLFLVYKVLETNLEDPYIYWIKYFKMDLNEEDNLNGNWKLVNTIKDQNEINQIIGVWDGSGWVKD